MLEKSLLRPFLIWLLRLLYRVEISGIEHYKTAGGKCVIIPNHQSFLDPFLLAVFLPEKPAFAMNIFQADKWYFRWLDKMVKLYKLDPSQPISMKRLMQDVKKGAKIVIFPEGRITTTGGIMKIYEGTGRIVEKTGANLLPIRIDGASYSPFSTELMRRKIGTRIFPKIRITILPPKYFAEGQSVNSRMIYDIMTEAAFMASNTHQTLLSAVLKARYQHGAGHKIASDISRKEMNYQQLFTRSFVLSAKLSCQLSEQYVGVLLPNSLGVLVTFVSLHMLGKVPCMLNFSSGTGNLQHACRIAKVKTILTSRTFIEKGKLEETIAALSKDYSVLYLEDIGPTVTLTNKLSGLIKGFFPLTYLQSILTKINPGDSAVILYTSGSEGAPKGVALSHSNILANVYQASARLDLTTTDILFNSLPVFHSFGLSIGMLMPLIGGIKSFYYPTPLHYRVIPELIYDTNATIMLGTDTFFQGYARYAQPYDFSQLRLAVAGAEKLKETTRHLYADKYRVNIMQGYGVTETAPAIAFNTPMEHKPGSVGRIFPMIKYKLEPVPGLETGGRLWVKGPNVMLGYLKADMPGIIQPQGEWYDTGDIVTIDEEGFITIQGRAKRFAKIAGEMVSLTVVEELAFSLATENAHAAIAIADERKGEQILLYTESKYLSKEQLQVLARERGLPEIYLPKKLIVLDIIPRLGSGKIDYVALALLKE